ncbi:hypothetical protein JZ751_027258 [Albula glossodonta]|uniref:Nedd4 family interacting protein 2 n=1 Tax=Albula glossodonta TaxID=121402 RepID=A0A8T2NCH8_9TELE|nr:hypothetical protein JZ751_027258 [Albula glossodonta]
MEHHQAASRYQVLHNEDDPSEASGSAEASTSAQAPPPANQSAPVEAEAPPPSYASIALGATAAPECSFHGDLPVPPPYSIATSLPTYDEAEKAKAAAMATTAVDVVQRPEDDFPPRDDFMAFLFNWIGFCLSFCLTNTIAGRYGAICGFGLSLIKWILIVRVCRLTQRGCCCRSNVSLIKKNKKPYFSDYFTGYFNGQYWLWWIFLVLGLLLFFRGFVNYLKVRNISENMAASHRTRFFFLY